MVSPTASKILYVNRTGDDGWLEVKPAKLGPLASICKYTQLQVLGSAGGRTSLTIMDGPRKGQNVSLSDSHVPLYLGTKAPTQTLAHIEVTYGKYVPGWISVARNNQALDQQMATLTIGSLTVATTMNTNWGTGFTPIPAGTYKVLVPDAPHDKNMTRYYRAVAPTLKSDQVWFPIKYRDNSRYVHVGNVSDGCTTVLDLDRWVEVCEAIISHRGSDGASVAHLVVKGMPERDN
jgi:hypothetical protein